MSSIEERDVCYKKNCNSKKYPLNYQYIEEKARISMYLSQCLDNEMDNKLNDSINYHEIIGLLNQVIELIELQELNKNRTIFYFDLGYCIGQLNEMLPQSYHEYILKIREHLRIEDYSKIVEKIKKILKLINVKI